MKTKILYELMNIDFECVALCEDSTFDEILSLLKYFDFSVYNKLKEKISISNGKIYNEPTSIYMNYIVEAFQEITQLKDFVELNINGGLREYFIKNRFKIDDLVEIKDKLKGTYKFLKFIDSEGFENVICKDDIKRSLKDFEYTINYIEKIFTVYKIREHKYKYIKKCDFCGGKGTTAAIVERLGITLGDLAVDRELSNLIKGNNCPSCDGRGKFTTEFDKPFDFSNINTNAVFYGNLMYKNKQLLSGKNADMNVILCIRHIPSIIIAYSNYLFERLNEIE